MGKGRHYMYVNHKYVHRINGMKTNILCPNCGIDIYVKINTNNVVAWCPGCAKKSKIGETQQKAISLFVGIAS